MPTAGTCVPPGNGQDIWNWYVTELKRIPDAGGFASVCLVYGSTGDWNQAIALIRRSPEYAQAQALGHIAPDAENNACGSSYGYPWSATGSYPISGSPVQGNVCKYRHD